MAFTGRATYSDFDSIAEDVAPLVSIISPRETPLLDLLGDPPYAARNVLHEWLDDSLAPNTIVASSAVTSSTADEVIGIAGGRARLIQAGSILRSPHGEYMLVSVVSGNSITVNRALGSTSANSFAAGQTIEVISNASLEGDDVTQDTSTDRNRRDNYLQLFKEDIIISNTQQAVSLLGGISDEYAYQEMKKTTEAVRNLEKAVIMGVSFGNTIGSSTARRTMKGLRSLIATNVQSVGPTLTESWLGNTIKLAWDNGGTDCDILLAGVNYKRIIDGMNGARKLIANSDKRFSNVVSQIETTFGLFNVVLSRWMPANELLVLASGRTNVLPLQGRSFRSVRVASQGDSVKGMVVGEYTVELRNEEGCARST